MMRNSDRPAASVGADVLARIAEAIADRCTCGDRTSSLAPLNGHEPDCSLQNTGWLS